MLITNSLTFDYFVQNHYLFPWIIEAIEAMERNELFICSCNSVEHQLIFSYFDDEIGGDVYCAVHLNPERNVFKRLWNAIKYVFGHRSIYGDFDEFIFKTSDADRLEKVVEYLKQKA